MSIAASHDPSSRDLRHHGLEPKLLEHLIRHHERDVVPRLRRLWEYYRNPIAAPDAESRPAARLAQSRGLPPRLANPQLSRWLVAGPDREVVIENDIAWRIQTIVDFMFGRPFTLQSCAADPDQATAIERLLVEIFEVNGGIAFFQDMALLGSIYGHVDVLVRIADAPANPHSVRATPDKGGHGEASGPAPTGRGSRPASRGANRLVLDLIEAPRGFPLLDPHDYRRLDAYVLHHRLTLNRIEPESLLRRVGRRMIPGTFERQAPAQARVQRTQVWTRDRVVTFEGMPDQWRCVDEGANRLGRMPVVHIQNLPQPFHYEGIGDVEPLIPLQDELNIRLSDRANRVTFQSFKMYLGKGIDQFTQRPIGPGQMWATDNPDASIEEFGGDAQSPSEEAHINEIREAMDKTSGVTPLAAGVLRNKVGHLTSENALRIVLMGLLAKTDRKRVAYGAGIERLCELVLHAADLLGILPNAPEDRRIRLDWPSPLPESQSQRLRDAKLKLELGVPSRQVLTELGYGDCMS